MPKIDKLKEIERRKAQINEYFSFGSLTTTMPSMLALFLGMVCADYFGFAAFAICLAGITCYYIFIKLWLVRKMEKLDYLMDAIWKREVTQTLTKKESDGGYSIKSSDLYEAIEKLGYLEHVKLKDPAD